MMLAKEFTFEVEGGLKIFVRKLLPEAGRHLKGIVLIVHGGAEHSGRYVRFGKVLNENGFVVYAHDQRGHGQTAANPAIIHINEGGFEGMVDDIDRLYKIAASEHPGLPIFLFAHSMGTIICRKYLQKYSGRGLKGTILCGAAHMPQIKQICDFAKTIIEQHGRDYVDVNLQGVLVNGFGATPLMELYLLNASVARELAKRKIRVARTFVGNYMTSLDMAGASISLLHLDEELELLLNAQSDAPAFIVNGEEPEAEYYEPYGGTATIDHANNGDMVSKEKGVVESTLTLDNMEYIIDVMCASIIENEIMFCELDAYAGDGDFGTSVANGFRQLKNEWRSVTQKSTDIGMFLHECALVIMEYCGGASGPIWGSAFRAAGKTTDGKSSLTIHDFVEMLQAAVRGIQKTGEQSFGSGADVGDKTLIDALVPCADAWAGYAKTGNSFKEAFQLGAKAAVDGAEKTKDFVARMGRAGTIGKRSLGHPDAGAYALGVIFTDVANSISDF